MAKKTRAELQREFAAELYVSASFFKMKTLGSTDPKSPDFKPELDAMVNRNSGASLPMANPHATIRYFPEREIMPKFPKGK